MALKGQAKTGGYFEVKDHCFAGYSFNSHVPNDIKFLGKQRNLNDANALQLDSCREFVAFISGMKFGYSDA